MDNGVMEKEVWGEKIKGALRLILIRSGANFGTDRTSQPHSTITMNTRFIEHNACAKRF